jgi:arylsulfatase A-like enzyme
MRSLLLILLFSGCCHGAERPNILLIVADDLGYNDLGSYAGAERYTPNLDQLAAAGTRFTRHYADSTCSASRAALLSGQYPSRVGFQPSGRGLPTDAPNLASSLAGAGYNSWHIGKWHLGSVDRDAWPLAVGFGNFFGFIDQWQLAGKTDSQGQLIPARPRYQNPWLRTDNGKPSQYQGHLTEILSDRAIAVIETEHQQPWFINLWYLAPHAPVQPASQPQLKDPAVGDYQLLIHQMDYQIGRVFKALRDSGNWDDTIIVFVSDNGAKDLQNNHPFPGLKASFMEGGIRTPLIIKSGGTALGEEIGDIASIRDIYPGLMETIGRPLQHDIDGRSFVPLLEGKKRPSQALYWESFGYLINSQYGVLSEDGNWRLNHRGRWSELERSRLYRLDGDAASALDVAAAQAEITQSMRLQLEQWHRAVHVVPIRSEDVSSTGHGSYTGAEMIRSPGHGPYTLAVAWNGPGSGADHGGYIAGQESFWELVWLPGKQQIALDLAGWQHQIPAPVGPGCHSVMMSGDFLKIINSWSKLGDRSIISLWVDGTKEYSATSRQVPDVTTATKSPLQIGVDALGDRHFPGRLSRPLVLTARVSDFSIYQPNDIHKTLCAELQHDARKPR